jgi:hypothetical protein
MKSQACSIEQRLEGGLCAGKGILGTGAALAASHQGSAQISSPSAAYAECFIVALTG